MKIYCSEQPHSVFDPYVGKNVWVKVKCLFGAKRVCYIRILDYYDYYGELCIHCNYFMVDTTQDVLTMLRRKVPSSGTTLRIDELELIEPVETLSGDQVFLNRRGGFIPDTFIGQPIWIKCNRIASWTDYYVKVLSQVQDVLECDLISVHEVDDYVYEGYDTNPPSDAICHGKYFSDVFAPYEPYDILTDEELHEIVAENDRIYWEGYQAEDADNYYNEGEEG